MHIIWNEKYVRASAPVPITNLTRHHIGSLCSLYPSVNKYARYPVGHPDIVTSHFDPLDTYFGIAKVKVLAPRGLYHPVLPYRSNGKLKFPLCRTCADEERLGRCDHSDDQRAFVGTWCTPELMKALDKGYELLEMWTESAK